MKRLLILISALALLLISMGNTPAMAVAGTPVLFTTNDILTPRIAGPYRVQYITVYVDDVKRGYTESNGYLTAVPVLLPGVHKVEYVWANCNNPAVCSGIYNRLTSYLLIPDQPYEHVVKIPTVQVKFVTKYGVNVCLNKTWLGVALGGGTLTKNVMAGFYTVSYMMGYSQPIPPWPDMPPYPGIPDPLLKGFYHLAFGSEDTYPNPGPHVVVVVPNYW